MLEYEGDRYEMLMMSDSADVMLLELWLAKPDDENMATGDAVARITRYENSGKYDLSVWADKLPVPLIERFIAEAKEALPPKQQAV